MLLHAHAVPGGGSKTWAQHRRPRGAGDTANPQPMGGTRGGTSIGVGIVKSSVTSAGIACRGMDIPKDQTYTGDELCLFATIEKKQPVPTIAGKEFLSMIVAKRAPR